MKNNLKKYLEIIKIGIKTSLQYRAEMFLWLIIDIIPMLSMVVLWLAVYSKGQIISGYNLDQMISYYIIGYFVSSIVSVHIEEYWVEEIRQGNISFILLKPFSFKTFALLDEVSWKIMYSFLVTLPTVFIATQFTDIFYLPNITHIVVLLLSLLIGFLIDAIFSFFVIAGGFIFNQAHSLSHLKWMLTWILSGAMIPYELMPSWLSSTSKILPFQYVFSTPLRLYLNPSPLSHYLPTLAQSILWVIALYIALKLFWKYAIKNYSAVGN
jgi:ABC-2 type transport system permease protein